MILDEYESFNKDEAMKFLDGIYNTSKKTYLLFQNLLLWARTQLDNMEYNPSEFQISSLINEAIELIRENASFKNISISNFTDNKLIVYADINMIGTILRNLISNAIKFTNDNGKIEIHTNVIDNFVQVSVEDNGVGIATDDLQKLFRIDQGFSTKGTKEETGTGLGLILCQEFVKKHDGNIWVESQPGKGSKITFTIKKM